MSSLPSCSTAAATIAINTVFHHDFGLVSPATLHPPSRSRKETQKNTKRIGTSFGTMWNTLWPMTKNVPSAISTREIQRYRDVSGRSAGDEATAISCMCRLYEQVRVKASWPTSIKHRQSHGLPKARPVPENSLVSTTQADKKKTCVDKTSSSWEFSAT